MSRTLIEYSDELYEKNLAKYFSHDPVTAVKLSQFDFGDYAYGYTHLGELNLLRQVGDQTLFYHDMEGAHEEAKQWYRSKDLANQTVLFLFGLGLGYYYITLKLWLARNPSNRLIFLEDELGVIERFLGTNLASEMLDNPQVVIHYLDLPATGNLQGNIHRSIDHLVKGYIRYNAFLGSNRLYTKLKEEMCLMIRDIIFYVSSWNLVITAEIVATESGILTNHFHNMLRQYRGSNGHLFKNLFKDVPAIICGAGPSIVNDIPELKELCDEALLIASGTGMNVLNYYGISPHFGVGLDPTDSQGTRIRTNFAYEVPFFYRSRFQAKSFDLLHGPKLYIQAYPSNEFTSWFDGEVGLELEDLPNQGVSSTNFAMQLARLMGCNPIILLGIDLAYTDSARYPPIISAHPTDSQSAKEEISIQSELPVYGKANSGKETITKIEWFEESKTIRLFKEFSPEIEIISCSREGLAISGVDFMPFSEVKKKYSGHCWDIRNRIHAQTVKSAPCCDKERGLTKMQEWNASLHKCTRIFGELEEELKRLWCSCGEGKQLASAPYNGKIALLEAEIWQEPVFKYQLADFLFVLDNRALDKKTEYRCQAANKTDTENNLMLLEIDLNYLAFFQRQLKYHDRHLREMIDKFMAEEKELEQTCRQEIKQASDLSLDEECYAVRGDFIVIDDQEMGIAIRAPFSPQKIPIEQLQNDDDAVPCKREIFLRYKEKIDGQYLQFNAQNILQAELYYRQGKLHGPSTHFHENGTILARSWYINGQKEGKTWQRYPSGAFYSLQRFQNGVWHGLQEYYYENGSLKSTLHYRHGQLDGEIRLYYPNGRLKRELSFIDGKLDGAELYYAPSGKLIWEAGYSLGHPQGYARVWHSNGQLARKYEYFKDQSRYHMQEWDRKGQLLAEEVNLLENLQQINEKRLKELTKAIRKFDKEMDLMKHLTKRERSLFVY